MSDQDLLERLHLLPVQIIPLDHGVVIRRGPVRLHVAGDGAGGIVEEIISALSGGGATEAEIVARFAPELQPSVGELVGDLVSHRMLTPAAAKDASPGEAAAKLGDRFDVFCWSFGADRASIRRELGARRIAIIGLNLVSRELARGLGELGLEHVEIVDHPLLRNVDCVDADGRPIGDGQAPVAFEGWAEAGVHPDCLVATSDFGGLGLMREWNAYCVEQGVGFFSAVLHDHVGYAGPLVVPGETPCFECFWLRQNSNLDTLPSLRQVDSAAFAGQVVDGAAPGMAAVLGRVAAFELFKHYAGQAPGRRSGSVVEIDLVDASMSRRRVLRVPRCPVCGARARHGRVTLEAGEGLPGNPFEG